MMARDADEKKRLTTLFAAGAAITVAVTLLLVFFIDNREPGEAPPPRGYELTDTDRADLEATARLFMDEAGTYGVREAAVTPDTILTLREQISQAPSPSIFLSRADVYGSLKQNYIAPGSPLDFTSVVDWSDDYLVDNMISSSLEDVAVTVPDEGFYMEDTPSARLSVNFTAHQVARWQTATDTSWDGTYDVLELKLPTSITLVLTKNTKGVWQVHSIENATYPSLLALTADPAPETLPEPRKVGTIKTSLDLPEVTEANPPVS